MKIKKFLTHLNKTYFRLHKEYEDLFWGVYMGDQKKSIKMQQALKKRDSFRANPKYLQQALALRATATKQDAQRLSAWITTFSKYQTPKAVIEIKNEIAALESKIHKQLTTTQEGYQDPYNGRFIKSSRLKMREIMRTNNDEKIRKACFESLNKLSVQNVDDYLRLIKLRNYYATKLGYSNFYEYKSHIEEGMRASEIFAIFNNIYNKTKKQFAKLRQLEKDMPGLRKPWNFSYMLAGDFIKEEDPYFQFSNALEYWGRSFHALGIKYNGSKLKLDLLDRKGKYANGFCHWPQPITYTGKKRNPGQSNFTCNTNPGQLGSGLNGLITLFHEGGHAAHYLNSEQTEVCLNTEYPPASTSWAETQSMFLDTLASSIEWKIRYAKNAEGKPYPFELFKRKVVKLNVLAPLDMMGTSSIVDFEKQVYTTKNLTTKKILEIAKNTFRKHTDYSVDSYWILGVPHLYSWESACCYHGYGLAELAVSQWRDYFYKKYGYIVDNPMVGKEMQQVWKLGSSKSFAECVKIATNKKLSPQSYINNITKAIPEILKEAKKRINKLKAIKIQQGLIDLDAKIVLVDGNKLITDNKKTFESMCKNYANYLNKHA